MTGYRIGCDVGGTFTDLICVTPTGEVVLDKTPTTLDDQSVGVMNGVGQLAERFGLSLEEFCRQLDIVVHGTTTADNTMIEMNGANTGLLVTHGHRDEIEMRRVHKEAIWDPSYPAPIPIARRRVRIPIPERCAYDGEELQPLDEDAVRAGIKRLRQFGCTSIAVMYLFSFVNPDHENRTLELIREEFPDVEHVSLSHEVMSAGPEFERVSTTLVNAYVAPRIAKYTRQLVESLRNAGYSGSVLIMQATGGVMPPDYVAKRAVTLLGSGPTGGVMGSAVAATAAGAPDFVAVDMGGTSFDICLVRGGRPEVKTDRNWRYRYYIGIPMVDVQSVGAGGGSIARVRQGALLVGPESAGSQPGPACYGRGGTNATVTDADAVLGYLPVDTFADGRMTLDVAASRSAIERDVAQPLGVDVVEAAWGIERIVNANMANAMRRVLSSYGADPRDLAMIAYGGNGPLHACALATELGAARVLVPKSAPAFSALGLLVADYVVDMLRSYVTPISQVDVEHLRGLMRELVEEAAKELAPAGLPDGAVTQDLFVQMAYGGQNSDMSVPCPEGQEIIEGGLLDLTERFHDLHESDRGFAFRNQQPQVRGLRLIARGATTKPGHLAELGNVADASTAQKGARPVYWGTEFVDTPVYDGRVLGGGASIAGPALVEEAFTVVSVAPGWSCTLDARGSYELTQS
ncbi:MAG TPA: hydantoinase/oxoprolinase family protein [Acidimicrobiales bacterium]|nr:hydantoinase/oxoprolinase family protein [Acidimicrobiales bacterium]